MLRKVGKNVLSNWGGLGVSMAVAFFMSPFLVRTLGDAQYGVWVLVLSVTGYMGLLDAGLKVSVVRFVAAHSATGDAESLGETISTALVIYSVLAVVIVSVAAVLGLLLDSLFYVPHELRSTARAVLIITGTTLSVTLLASVFNGFLAGLQRYDITNAIAVGLTLAGAFAIYAVVAAGQGIVGLAIVQLVSQVVSGILLWSVSRRLRPGVYLSLKRIRFGRIKELYSYSFFVLLNTLAMLLLFRSGELLAGAFLGVASVTYFAIGGMLVEYLGKIIGSATQVLHPLASGKHALDDQSDLRVAMILSTRACIAIALPACAGFVILGKPFIAAWMGAQYAEVSAPILVVLATARLFWLAQSGAGNILLGSGRHKQLTMLTATTGLVGTGLAVMLVDVYGLIGIAMGLAAAIVVFQGIVMPSYVCRTMNIGVFEYVRDAVAGPVLATLPFVLVLYFLRVAVQPTSVLSIAVLACSAAPFFLVTAYYTCLDRRARDRLKQYLEVLRRR